MKFKRNAAGKRRSISRPEAQSDTDKSMPVPSRSRRSDDAMAADLCVLLLLSGKHEGRFAMRVDALMAASKIPGDLFRATQAWAVQCDWLRTRSKYVELKAAGIHVAKRVLDLPR